jgi:D-alanine--poly(phosphoribitol) ligase, subunit 2
MDNTKEKIISILKDTTGLDNIGDDQDANLFAEGILDSMATVEVLVALQDEFGIEVPVSEFDRNEWNTINKMTQRVVELES